MYKAPPENVERCWYCDNIGKAIGAIQKAIGSLETIRKDWLTADAISELTV